MPVNTPAGAPLDVIGVAVNVALSAAVPEPVITSLKSYMIPAVRVELLGMKSGNSTVSVVVVGVPLVSSLYSYVPLGGKEPFSALYISRTTGSCSSVAVLTEPLLVELR